MIYLILIAINSLILLAFGLSPVVAILLGIVLSPILDIALSILLSAFLGD